MEFLNDIIKRYGLPFALLLLAIYWLNARLEQIETRLQGCEADKFKIITENNERSNAVIAQNTIALSRNTEVMESIKSYIGLRYQTKKLLPVTAKDPVK